MAGFLVAFLGVSFLPLPGHPVAIIMSMMTQSVSLLQRVALYMSQNYYPFHIQPKSSSDKKVVKAPGSLRRFGFIFFGKQGFELAKCEQGFYGRGSVEVEVTEEGLGLGKGRISLKER